MPAALLAQRKQQLELLRQVCRRQEQASVAFRRARSGDRLRECRFVALDEDALVLRAHAPPRLSVPTDPAFVSVEFLHDGARYHFRTRTHTLRRTTSTDGSNVLDLRLQLPLCVEPAERRKHVRVTLPGDTRVDAQLESLLVRGTRETVRLKDVSTAGFSITVDAATAERLIAQPLYRAEFRLPDDNVVVHWVVRLAAARPLPPNGVQSVLAFCLCAGDDPERHAHSLARVARFASRWTDRSAEASDRQEK